MKRCPQCHFTFEDREQVCDFDGTKLTPFDDPAPLSDRIVPPSKKSNLLRFTKSRSALAGLAGVFLLLGIFLVMRHNSSSPPPLEEKASTPERSKPIETSPPTRKPRRRIAYARKPAHRSHAAIARASTRRRISTPTRTKRVRSSPTDFSKEEAARSEKKDSKLNLVFKKSGKALKKTFSILKKPFGI